MTKNIEFKDMKIHNYTVDVIYAIINGDFVPEIKTIEELSALKIKAKEFKYKKPTDLLILNSYLDMLFSNTSCNETLNEM